MVANPSTVGDMNQWTPPTEGKAPHSKPRLGQASCRYCADPARYVTAGMCTAHYMRWVRLGRPDPEWWDGTTPVTGPSRKCAVVACDRLAEGASMCRSHQERLRRMEDPPPFETFIATAPPIGYRAGELARRDAAIRRRRAQGLTLRQVADEFGLSESFVSRVVKAQ